MKLKSKIFTAITLLNLSAFAGVIDKKGVLNISDSIFSGQNFEKTFINNEIDTFVSRNCILSNDDSSSCEVSETRVKTESFDEFARLTSISNDGEWTNTIYKEDWIKLNENPARYYMQELKIEEEVSKKIEESGLYSLALDEAVIEIVGGELIQLNHLGQLRAAMIINLEIQLETDGIYFVIPMTYTLVKGQTLTKTLNNLSISLEGIANSSIRLKQ